VAGLKADAGLKLMPVPYEGKLRETYLPAQFTSKDYPDLMKQGTDVNTIAVGAVMAVFNWSHGNTRYNRVVKFIDAFFSKFGEFQKPPRHPKWREVNLAAELPGWSRFSYAKQWLANHRPQPTADLKHDFKKFVTAQGATGDISQPQLEALFREFVQWQQKKQ
jgi:hypothetical protein